MESYIVEFMQLFGVNRAFAILLMFELMCLVIAAPMVLHSAIRLKFHAMHFDVLKNDVKDAKEYARKAESSAMESVKVVHKIISGDHSR